MTALAALLAAVQADPDELHTRMVYADALSDAGDPRGELIALQCGAGDAAREQALLAAHGTAWLGRLAPIVEQTRYVCGFLDAARVKKVARPKIQAAIGDPIWSTVRELWFDEAVGGVVVKHGPVVRGAKVVAAALLSHPVMRSLRVVGGIDGDVFTTLCTGAPLPFHEVRLRTYPLLEREGESWRFEAAARDAIAEAPGLPALRDLTLHGYPGNIPDVAWLLAAPIAKRLQRLQLENFGGTLDHWITVTRGTTIPLVQIDQLQVRNGDELEVDARRLSPVRRAELARIPADTLRKIVVHR